MDAMREIMEGLASPPIHRIEIPRDVMLADWYVERLEQHFLAEGEKVGDDEVLIPEVVLANGATLVPTWFGYHNPDMVIVDGFDPDGDKVRLLSHVTGVQLLLRIAKKDTAPPDRGTLGFQPRGKEAEEG